MPNKEIVEYIKKELRNGFHISDIKAALYKAGHKAEHVEDSVEHIYHHHAHMHTAIVLTVVLIVSLFIALGYNIFSNTHLVELDYNSEVIEVPEVVEEQVKAPVNEPVVEEPVNAPEENSQYVQLMINSAVTYDTADYCDNLKIDSNHFKCLFSYYTPKAVVAKDMNICESITDETFQELCRMKVRAA